MPIRALLGTCLLLLVGSSLAVDVPHVFVDGSTISASQVNENFAALAASMPGVASSATSSSVSLTLGTAQVVRSISITVPAGGQVIVDAQFVFNARHANGTRTQVGAVLSTSTGDFFVPSAFSVYMQVPPEAPTAFSAVYAAPASLRRVFPVAAAGTYTFHLVAKLNEGGNNFVNVFLPAMTALYVPTSFGATVSVTHDGPGDPSPLGGD
jgi:hypothetical protein